MEKTWVRLEMCNMTLHPLEIVYKPNAKLFSQGWQFSFTPQDSDSCILHCQEYRYSASGACLSRIPSVIQNNHINWIRSGVLDVSYLIVQYRRPQWSSYWQSYVKIRDVNADHKQNLMALFKYLLLFLWTLLAIFCQYIIHFFL